MTDNIDLKKELSLKYPYILTYNSAIGHSEKEVLQGYSQVAVDSLNDMYLLSKFDIIVKTYYN